MGGDNGGWEEGYQKGGSLRNMYKGHMDKAKGGQDRGWEVGMAGVGGKWRQLYLNNKKKKEERNE